MEIAIENSLSSALNKLTSVQPYGAYKQASVAGWLGSKICPQSTRYSPRVPRINAVHSFMEVADVACPLRGHRDLQEVCESRLQFGLQVSIPVFGGSRGNDVFRSIQDIQARLRWL